MVLACYPQISVSTVTVLVHLATIVLVFTCGSLSARLLRIFTSLRLKNCGHAPLAFDGYASGRWSPIDLLRKISYARPGVSGIIVVALLLIPAELVLDLGVKPSNRCCPRKIITEGICANRRKSGWEVSTASEVRMLPWTNEQLGTHPIREGFRRDVDGSEYFGAHTKPNTSLPIVIEGCRSSPHELLPARAAKISIGWNHPMQDHSAGIATANEITIYGTKTKSDIFVMHNTLIGVQLPPIRIGKTGFNFTVFESLDKESNQNIRASINRSLKWTELVVNARVMRYTVSCSISSLKPDDARDALLTYRYSEIEAGNPKRFDFTHEGKVISAVYPMTSADITPALLAKKIMESAWSPCLGETWVWTTCGIYDLKYAAPMIAILSALTATWIIFEIVLRRSNHSMEIPITAHEWFEFAMSVCAAEDKTLDVDRTKLEYEMNALSNKASVRMIRLSSRE